MGTRRSFYVGTLHVDRAVECLPLYTGQLLRATLSDGQRAVLELTSLHRRHLLSPLRRSLKWLDCYHGAADERSTFDVSNQVRTGQRDLRPGFLEGGEEASKVVAVSAYCFLSERNREWWWCAVGRRSGLKLSRPHTRVLLNNRKPCSLVAAMLRKLSSLGQ